MGEFLGTGDVGADELEEARAIFRDIFINPLRARGVHETALAASTNLRRRVDLRVEERRAGATAHADVLGRLLAPNGAARLHGDEVQAQLAGLIVAWAASLPRAMAFTLDWLVDAPEAMARAQLAAEADDLQAVWRVLLEAMQAHPPAPGVERHCLRAGSLQGGPVPCEGQVMVVLTSAMWDPAFAAGARGEGLQNLPFGYGMHQCLGRRIAEVQLSAIAIELLRRPNVRRAGKLEIDGPYPSRLDLAFDAVR
jgi:cytochrome P450